MGRLKKELVDHPQHYSMEGRKECIIEMEEEFGVKNVMIFCYLNSYKYLYRLGNKDDAEQDLNKAIWYFEYVDKLAEKWKTEPFDVRMRQQLEKMIKDAKRKVKKMKKENVE